MQKLGAWRASTSRVLRRLINPSGVCTRLKTAFF